MILVSCRMGDACLSRRLAEKRPGKGGRRVAAARILANILLLTKEKFLQKLYGQHRSERAIIIANKQLFGEFSFSSTGICTCF